MKCKACEEREEALIKLAKELWDIESHITFDVAKRLRDAMEKLPIKDQDRLIKFLRESGGY